MLMRNIVCSEWMTVFTVNISFRKQLQQLIKCDFIVLVCVYEYGYRDDRQKCSKNIETKENFYSKILQYICEYKRN